MAEIIEQPSHRFSATKAYRAYTLGLLLVVAISNYADRFLLGILAPAIKSELGLSDSQLGLITGAAFATFYAILGVPIASLADRYSRRTIIAVSLVLWSAMTCLCGLVQSFIQLVVLRVLVGIGEAGCTPPSHSLIADYFSRSERTLAMAVYATGTPIGIVVSFLIGGWFAETLGWRWALIIFGAPGVLIAITVLFTLREPPRGHSDGLVKLVDAPDMYSAVRKLWANRTYRHMVLGGAMNYLIIFAIFAWIPSVFVRSYGLNISTVGAWLAFTVALPQFVGLLVGGLVAKRLAIRNVRAPIRLCVFAPLSAAPFYAVALLSPTATSAFLWLSVPCFLAVLQGPTLLATIQAVSDVQSRAVASALMSLIINLIAGVFGAQLVGVVSDLLTGTFGIHSQA